MPIQRSQGVQPMQVSPLAALLAAGQRGIDRGFELARQTQAEQKRDYYASLQQAAQERKQRSDERYREKVHRRSMFEADRSFDQRNSEFAANMGLRQQEMGLRERMAGVGHSNRLAEIMARRDSEIDVLRERARLEAEALPSGGMFGGGGGVPDLPQGDDPISIAEFFSTLDVPPEEKAKHLTMQEQQVDEQLTQVKARKVLSTALGNDMGKGVFGAREVELQGAKGVFSDAKAELAAETAHRAKIQAADNLRAEAVRKETMKLNAEKRDIERQLSELDVRPRVERDAFGEDKVVNTSRRKELTAEEKAEEKTRLNAALQEIEARRQQLGAGNPLLPSKNNGIGSGVPVDQVDVQLIID